MVGWWYVAIIVIVPQSRVLVGPELDLDLDWDLSINMSHTDLRGLMLYHVSRLMFEFE